MTWNTKLFISGEFGEATVMPVSRRTRRNDAPTVYVGWHRANGTRKWCPIAVWTTWHQCWRRVLDRLPPMGGSSVVLEVPKVP